MNHRISLVGNWYKAADEGGGLQTIKQCFFCGSKDLQPFAMVSWKPNRLHVAQVRCNICGLLIAQPQASSDELKSYYMQHFYEETWRDAEAIWAANIKNYQKQEIFLMEQLWSDWLSPGGGSVVEIGCGYGAMLSILRDKGYHVYGFDMSPKATAFCNSKGLHVVEACSEKIPFKPATFDLSISMYVIEHINDPRTFVKEAVKLVRPGGVVVLITDDAGSTQYAWYRFRALIAGRISPLCSSSDHTFVFKENHIRTLMQQAGCEDIRLKKFDFIPEHESLHWYIYKSLFRLLDRMTGRGEFMIAVGRRLA